MRRAAYYAIVLGIFPIFWNPPVAQGQGGEPSVLVMDRAIRRAKSLPQVWFTTRAEIAQWWLERKYS